MEWGSSRRKSRRPFRNLCASVFRKSAPWSSTETGRRWEAPARKAQLEEFVRQHGKAPAEALHESLAAFFAYVRKGVRILQSQRDMNVSVPGSTACSTP